MSNGIFRSLYHSLLGYEGASPYRDVLAPAQGDAFLKLTTLGEFRSLSAGGSGAGADDLGLWDFYALSRLSDALLLPFQSGERDGSSWRGPKVSPEQRADFFVALGMEPVAAREFHPFHHEIVEVAESRDPAEPPSVAEVLWPGFMFGELIFCRAGVRVRAGRYHVRKEIAENSTMYFTHRRKNRPTEDLSRGWGSNSQWRTSFRRDYDCGDRFVYNADGEREIAAGTPETSRAAAAMQLTPGERVELLVNRCFVFTGKPDADLWPYDDRHTEGKPPPAD